MPLEGWGELERWTETRRFREREMGWTDRKRREEKRWDSGWNDSVEMVIEREVRNRNNARTLSEYLQKLKMEMLNETNY
jgi:hypothetical protein